MVFNATFNTISVISWRLIYQNYCFYFNTINFINIFFLYLLFFFGKLYHEKLAKRTISHFLLLQIF